MNIYRIVQAAILLAALAPSVLYLTGTISLDQSKWALLTATGFWFITAGAEFIRRSEEGPAA